MAAGVAAPPALELEPLAQLVGALLELFLQLLLLLLEHLGIDRRAVEGLAEPGERHREGDLARDLVLDADVEARAALHGVQEVVLEGGRLGEAAVRETERIAPGRGLALVHRETDAGLQHQPERQQEAHHALRLAAGLRLVDGDRHHGLALVGDEVARRVADLGVAGRILAADLGPIGLGRLGLHLNDGRALLLALGCGAGRRGRGLRRRRRLRSGLGRLRRRALALRARRRLFLSDAGPRRHQHRGKARGGQQPDRSTQARRRCRK